MKLSDQSAASISAPQWLLVFSIKARDVPLAARDPEGILIRQGIPPLQLHHCFSQGIPFLSPSIFTPGQLARKYLASAQELICEQ